MDIKRISAHGISASCYRDWIFTERIGGYGKIEEKAVSAMNDLLCFTQELGISAKGFVKCSILLSCADSWETCVSAWSRVFGENIPAMSFIEEKSSEKEFFFMDVVYSGKPVVRFYQQENDRYPAAVRAGDYVFVSAQTANTSGDLFDETTEVLEKLEKALKLAGCTRESAVKNQVFVTDCSQFDSFNIKYKELFKRDENAAARSLIGVTGIAGGKKVALESIAYTGEGRMAVSTPDAPDSPTAPYCQAVKTSELVFVSGQVGRDVKINAIVHPLPEESQQTFRNIFSILRAAGSSPSSIVKTNSFLQMSQDVTTYTSQLNGVMGKHLCANVLYSVSELARPTLAVEMDAIAAAE